MISRIYKPKQYTRKEWNRFDINIQEKLCQRYNIFLIDIDKNGNIRPVQTKKQKAINFFKKLDPTLPGNLRKQIKAVQKGTRLVKENLDNFDKIMGKSKRPMAKNYREPKVKLNEPKSYSGLTLSRQKDYSGLVKRNQYK